MAVEDGKTRFDNKADVYNTMRASYPSQIVEYILMGLNVPIIAEVGAGTGKFTSLLLEKGAKVYAVEPNNAMREKLTELLGSNPNLHIINGSAEETTLPSGVADLVVAAHAFHYFDVEKSKEEFKRILKNNGRVALVWNWQAEEREPAMREYRTLIYDCAVKTPTHAQENMTKELFNRFFKKYEIKVCANDGFLDFETLLGRTVSANYSPNVGEQGYDKLHERLKEWFDKYKQGDRVKFCYDTTVYFGDLK